MRPEGGTSGCGVRGGGILPLYMRLVGGTSGCWRAGWRNIVPLYIRSVGRVLAVGVRG
jgi:hypothetical protein